jgi:hypothetical protein
VKFKHLGETGQCSWKYSLDNNRFNSYEPPAGNVVFDNINWLNDGFINADYDNSKLPVSNQFPTKPNNDNPF